MTLMVDVQGIGSPGKVFGSRVSGYPGHDLRIMGIWVRVPQDRNQGTWSKGSAKCVWVRTRAVHRQHDSRRA